MPLNACMISLMASACWKLCANEQWTTKVSLNACMISLVASACWKLCANEQWTSKVLSLNACMISGKQAAVGSYVHMKRGPPKYNKLLRDFSKVTVGMEVMCK